MPTVLVGYYFAKQQVFQKVRVPQHWSMSLVGISLIVLALTGRAALGSLAGFNMHVIHATLCILGILIIFNACKLPNLSQVLTSLGNLSVYMWFFHALFFTDIVRIIYQPFILISDNIFIITIWAILLTYVCSWMLRWIVEKVGSLMSK